MLALTQLQAGYPRHSCVRGLTLQLTPGRLVVVLGANGVGKTTLLRTLAGLCHPLAGTVQLDSRPLHAMSVRERARCMALALAEDGPGFAGTVREMILLGRHPYRGRFSVLDAGEMEWVERAARALQIYDWLDKPLPVLSSGMLQRVMLARLWVQQTPVMLLDEPLAHLDWPARYFVMRWLQQLAQTENRTVIISAHEVGLALQYADDALLLTGQDAWQFGTPEELGVAGHLAALYGEQGLLYDPYEHDLRPVSHATGRLRIASGASLELWLRHAAERSGWQVDPAATTELASEGTGFRLTWADGRVLRAADWQALVQLLRAESSQGSAVQASSPDARTSTV